MKKNVIIDSLVAFCILVVMGLGFGCTQQQMAKEWGGTATIDLPAGEQLVNATWKDVNMWYLTCPRPTNVAPRAYIFKESSNFGVMQGTVVIREH